MTKQMHSLKEIIYYIITNLDSELIIQLTYASHGPQAFTFPYLCQCQPQSVNSNLFLYADYSCLMFQQTEVEEIEKVLNNNLSLVC